MGSGSPWAWHPQPGRQLPGLSWLPRATANTRPSLRLRVAGNLRPPDRADRIAAPATGPATVRIQRHKVLGGLIHQYERAAW